jgi:hypothetical protein
MRIKGESLGETLGCLDALAPRVARVALPGDRSRPVVLSSYNGARRGANLTPLVALLLARYGVPVLVHGLAGAGALDVADGDDEASDDAGYGRVTSARICGSWHPAVPGDAEPAHRRRTSRFPCVARPRALAGDAGRIGFARPRTRS